MKTALTIWVLFSALYYTRENAVGATPDPGAPCPNQLLGAFSSPAPVPDLTVYRPTHFAPARVDASTEPGTFFDIEGNPKVFSEAYSWHGTWIVIARYGRPFQIDGKWFVDFHAQAVLPVGERRLWRMPAKDFFEGVGQNGQDWE